MAEIIRRIDVNDGQIRLFDDFVVDRARGCLLHAGRPVHLRPQAFTALEDLAASRGRLVTKGQLTTEVWNGRAVTDDSLVQCIGDIRRALGDEKGHRLRTVRGRGYILELEGTETRAAATPGAVATQPTTPRLRIGVVFATAAVFAATMAMLVWMFPSKAEVPVDTSSFVKLTSSSAIELRPSLSPDGRWLMFDALTAPEFDDDSQIYLQPVSGGSPFCLTCGRVGGYPWRVLPQGRSDCLCDGRAGRGHRGRRA